MLIINVIVCIKYENTLTLKKISNFDSKVFFFRKNKQQQKTMCKCFQKNEKMILLPFTVRE